MRRMQVTSKSLSLYNQVNDFTLTYWDARQNESHTMMPKQHVPYEQPLLMNWVTKS